MSGYTTPEVDEPILNTPFEKPIRYWYIQEGEPPVKREGKRRPSIVFPPRDQKEPWYWTGPGEGQKQPEFHVFIPFQPPKTLLNSGRAKSNPLGGALKNWE